MDNVNTTLSEIYEVLLQLRYPEITKAESKDIGSTILTGESRLSLLSWLLAQEHESIGNVLKKLSGVALEDELFKHYSQIGICNNKDSLLGKCPLNEQYSTLEFLLKFMKNVHLKSGASILLETSIDNVLEAYITKDSNIIPLIKNVNSKMTYSEAIAYFKSIEKDLQDCPEKHLETNSMSTDVLELQEYEDCINNVDEEVFQDTKKEFTEAFDSMSLQQSAARTIESDPNFMDDDIDSIYTNFSNLQQVLEAKDKITKFCIPKDFQTIDSPLNEVIESIVRCMEEVKNVRISDS